MRKLSELIKLDKYTNKIQEPSLILKTRNFDIIGKIPKYTNWNTSFVGNGLDEISFEVHKYTNGKLCPVWDDLVDLKVVNVDDYKNFEIQVEYTDSTETIKSVHGVSLETELGQLYLNDFHVNDEEATSAIITEYNKDSFDEKGNFIPTVLCDFDNPKRSLLHRVLKDKAPHWSIGYVTPYVTLSEDDDAELVEKFQRTYTVDGKTIYDFLTGTVAPESNVIFIFDTLNRRIDCYSLCDCYIKDGDTRKQVCSAIGEDTKVLISKKKLANEISISSNKDSVKNCFRIEGGDDIITDMVRAVNMNGSNYIYQFADFQYNDMPENLAQAIKDYQSMMSSPEKQEEYYGEQGIFTRLCDMYKQLAYLQSEMMPAVSDECPFKNAKSQYDDLKSKLTSMIIGVLDTTTYKDGKPFQGVTNNVEAMAQILIDSRYSLKIIEETTSYNSSTKKWTGTIQITRMSDETDYYPKAINGEHSETITVSVDDDKSDPLNLPYTRQKIDKALSKGDMSLVDYDADQLQTDEQKYAYFNQYCQNKLQSFVDGYNSCLSVLMSGNVDSDIKDTLYAEYKSRYDIVSKVLEERNAEVSIVDEQINSISKEQAQFQQENDFYTYLENVETGLYKKFCAYRREDTYSNSNYISDGLETTSDLIKKAQELMKVAETELKKACVLQRTVSASLNNLFALKEFEPLYDSFDLFNYIRVQTEDELLKLRLIGVDISGDSLSDINVTFSEQVETVDGNMTDLESIIQQASSIASSYSSTALQAKQGSEARNRIAEIYSSGLNAANAMLKNSDNNEVTISASGIIAKRMDDEGFYGAKALRIIGNGIYMTEDNWATVAMAIGEITFTDPITNITSQKYGVIADAIVGNMIVGQNMVIGNDKGTVSINGDGIIIYDGKGVTDENKVFYADNDGNLNLKAHIEAQSGRIANFNISENELYTDEATFDNTTGLYFGENGLRLGSNFKVTNGGELTASSGKIANFNFDTNALYTDGATFSNTTGTYFGSSGLRIGGGYKVDSSGNITSSGTMSLANGNLTYSSANGLVVKGNIQANGGSFSGNITSSAVISGGTISGATISCKDIMGDGGFEVNSNGYMSATNANISGNITASKLIIDDEIYMKTSGVFLMPTPEKVIWVESVSDMQINLSKTIRLLNGTRIADFVFDNTLDGNTIYSKGTMKLNAQNDIILKNEGGTIGFYPKSFRPYSDYDGTFSLGWSGMRWDTIYAKVPEIDSSDRNMKHDIKNISEKYKRLFFKLKPCSYVFNDGVRTHIGAISQDVEEALEEVGLTAKEFAGFCKDKKTKDIIDENGNMQEELVFDDNGNPEYIYSLRYGEFIMLNTYMLQEAYKIIESQQKEINELKTLIQNNE